MFCISRKAAVYCSISASLLQHMTMHVYRVTCALFIGRDLPPSQTAVPFLHGFPLSICYIMTYIVVYVFGYFCFAYRNKNTRVVEIKDPTLITVMLIALLAIYILWDIALRLEQSNLILFNIIYAFCCFALLDILSRANRAEIEEKIMRRLLAEEQAHYNALASNIEMINRKCHDFKYQIIALQNTMGDEEKKAQLQQLQQEVSIYENLARTGNVALDNTLNEKSMICEKDKIRFYYTVDGSLFSFMEALDIYVLFGNALDNAIECVQKYKDEQKRFICIYTFSRGGILKVRIENYCEEKVKFAGGIPQTSKQDKIDHGYGIKSMKRIVQKYGGNLTVSWQENLFYTDILLPLSVQK